MRVLSFDTSTSVLHLCLMDRGQVVDERQCSPITEHRQEVASLIMPEIDKAFKTTGWTKKDLCLIVVGTGPGSFTGIRVAVVTARTLGQALNVPVVGVSGLETCFYVSPEKQPAAVIQSTTSRLFFFGGFVGTDEDPVSVLITPESGDADTVLDRLSGLKVWYGDQKAMEALAGASCRPLPLIKNLAVAQAELALHRLSLRGLTDGSDKSRSQLAETFPWSNVLPLYLRSPSVTLKKTYANPHPANEP